MIEALRVRPCGQVLPAQLREFFLKFRDCFAAFGVAGGNHATLAGIVTQKMHRTELERLEFVRRAEQAVFLEGRAAGEFQIRAKAPPEAFQFQPGIPLLNGAQAGLADHGGAEGGAIIRETFLRFTLQIDRVPKELAQPAADAVGFIQMKLRLRGLARLPETD
jgi:hypothetical protein